MRTQTTILNGKIRISEPQISDVYFIEEDEGRFFITSENGYSGYEGEGFQKLEQSIRQVNKFIKMYFINRCEDNPKGW